MHKREETVQKEEKRVFSHAYAPYSEKHSHYHKEETINDGPEAYAARPPPTPVGYPGYAPGYIRPLGVGASVGVGVGTGVGLGGPGVGVGLLRRILGNLPGNKRYISVGLGAAPLIGGAYGPYPYGEGGVVGGAGPYVGVDGPLVASPNAYVGYKRTDSKIVV